MSRCREITYGSHALLLAWSVCMAAVGLCVAAFGPCCGLLPVRVSRQLLKDGEWSSGRGIVRRSAVRAASGRTSLPGREPTWLACPGPAGGATLPPHPYVSEQGGGPCGADHAFPAPADRTYQSRHIVFASRFYPAGVTTGWQGCRDRHPPFTPARESSRGGAAVRHYGTQVSRASARGLFLPDT